MSDESDPAQVGVDAALTDFDQSAKEDGGITEDAVKGAVTTGAAAAAAAACTAVGAGVVAPFCAMAGGAIASWVIDNIGPVLEDIGGAIEDAWDSIFGSDEPEYHLVEAPGGTRSKQEKADAHFVNTLASGVVELAAQLDERLIGRVNDLVALAAKLGVKHYGPTPRGMSTEEFRRTMAIPFPVSAERIIGRLRDHGLALEPVDPRLVGTLKIERSSSGQALLWPYSLRPPDFHADAMNILWNDPSFLQKANDLGALGQRVIDWGAEMYKAVAREATTLGVDAIAQHVLPRGGAAAPTLNPPDVTLVAQRRLAQGVSAGVTFLFNT
ncbi:MAG TPA: hypothetical protein VN896_07940 [Methylomirabilota bacterium]|nr:hypothetical protein [Methylomirabilota bacterium]